jgi:hypothetical protein
MHFSTVEVTDFKILLNDMDVALYLKYLIPDEVFQVFFFFSKKCFSQVTTDKLVGVN